MLEAKYRDHVSHHLFYNTSKNFANLQRYLIVHPMLRQRQLGDHWPLLRKVLRNYVSIPATIK